MSARALPIVVAIVAVGAGAWWWLHRTAEPSPPSASAQSSSAVATTADPVAAPPRDRPRPTLPDQPPPLPAEATADQKFDAEPIDRTWASTTQVALAERLKTVSNVKATECHTLQCRIVVIGTQREIGKSIELLTSDRALHSFARTITLTAPTRRDDTTIELHAFAHFER
jgi:hypothetical protein